MGENMSPEQWEQIKKRLSSIDAIHDKVLIMETKLGIQNGNGLFGRVKKLEERPKRFKSWIPVIICILIFFSNIAGDWIQTKITQSQIVVTATPAPTP